MRVLTRFQGVTGMWPIDLAHGVCKITLDQMTSVVTAWCRNPHLDGRFPLLQNI